MAEQVSRNSLSKEAVAEGIRQQNRQQQPLPSTGLLGVPGTPRDPIAMQARMAYNLYATQQMERGLPAMTFEAWQKQRMAPPNPPQRGLLDPINWMNF